MVQTAGKSRAAKSSSKHGPLVRPTLTFANSAAAPIHSQGGRRGRSQHLPRLQPQLRARLELERERHDWLIGRQRRRRWQLRPHVERLGLFPLGVEHPVGQFQDVGTVCDELRPGVLVGALPIRLPLP